MHDEADDHNPQYRQGGIPGFWVRQGGSIGDVQLMGSDRELFLEQLAKKKYDDDPGDKNHAPHVNDKVIKIDASG